MSKKSQRSEIVKYKYINTAIHLNGKGECTRHLTRSSVSRNQFPLFSYSKSQSKAEIQQ